nr:phage antirepressor KilAC domain-containing protein [Asaia platycodi]
MGNRFLGDGSPVTAVTKSVTETEALDLAGKTLAGLRKTLLEAVHVSLAPWQEGALLSWQFNVGSAAMRSSTLVALLNRGFYAAAGQQLLRWDKATVNGRLIVRSKRPEAERFERWVFEEVLPAIRKTGGYMTAAPEETPEALAARALAVLQATVARQKAALAETLPKAEVYDRLVNAEGSLCITAAAKNLHMRPKALFDWLAHNGWIYRRPGADHWLGYQAHTSNGDLDHKITTVTRPDGTEKVTEQVRITAKGLARLEKLMPERLHSVA